MYYMNPHALFCLLLILEMYIFFICVLYTGTTIPVLTSRPCIGSIEFPLVCTLILSVA